MYADDDTLRSVSMEDKTLSTSWPLIKNLKFNLSDIKSLFLPFIMLLLTEACV